MASRLPDDLFITLLRSAYGNARHSLASRRPARAPKLPADAAASRRQLSCLTLGRTRAIGPAQVRLLSALQRGRRGYAAVDSTKRAGPPFEQKPRQIAVLGGGVTGLTAAHYLARHATNAHITLYEASDRLGGWVDGRRTPIDDGSGGEVLMQRGPRMLRSGATSNKYDDLVFYDVVANLKLQSKVKHPKAAAGTRYIYYPDHLVQLPEPKLTFENITKTLRSLFSEPIWTGCMSAFWRWQSYFNSTPEEIESRRLGAGSLNSAFNTDESVSEFLGRIFADPDAPPIKNLVSGMLHGIYGGDVAKLSAKHTIFDRFWYQSKYPLHEGFLWFALKDFYLQYDMLDGPNSRQIIEMAEAARSHNLMAFEDGLLTLVDALSADLKGRKNVTIKTDTPVSSLEYKDGRVEILSDNGERVRYDQALSTLFSGQLADLAKPANSLPSLAATEAVSIQVVNLWYPDADLLSQNPGFGYLIPQSVDPEQNPECALGVLFDSDIETGKDETKGTKLTVMLGGHYWSDWPVLPTEEMGIAMARAVVERHLGISPDEHVVAGAKLCRDCIPQHTVGHFDRLRKAHYELEAAFKGKLTVAGPSYTQVGVIPAMRSGYDAGMRIAKGHGQPWFRHPEKDKGMWGHHNLLLKQIRERTGQAPEIMDHIGTTGLEWATESPASQMTQGEQQFLWFKTWTKESERFLDGQGKWKPDDQNPMRHTLLPSPDKTEKQAPQK
ncbi:hypothetical protein JX265_004829 [Neoarthrinium moseri]|uniref:protoporphyrinogen oxidase n=1 Tax=Neoarthrinium moseri TaxID=1658444 RepID=A0A9P9WPZ0_9PEZI|nr:hypothetical protein JX265_004829 [Neoarthrinium moseri]